VTGETGARIAARRRRSGILLIAGDLDRERADRIRRWAAEASVPVFAPFDAEALGEAAGRDRVRVLFVYDRSLCRSLAKALGGGGGF
jgi:ribosomal protein L7Ae-like RNA K-turn-binding protein